MKKSGKLIGAGIGLAAVAAAGAYFLYGEKGAARNREKITGWTLKMKGEVLEKVEALKSIDREAYHELVDKVATRYAKLEKVSASELRHLTVELKNAWTHISKQLK